MIGSIIGGIIGNNASEASRDAAKNAINEAVKIIDEVGAPPDLSAKIYYEQLKQAGVITPENEQEVKAGLSAYTQIKEDEQVRNSQISALEQLSNVAGGGLRPEDKAAFNQMKQQTAVESEGKMQQIGQSFQQRGMGGAGAELANKLISAQEGTNRLSSEGDDIAAEASKRALEALSNQANVAGQVRSQDYQKSSDMAAAKDRISQFNAQNSQAVQARNVQNRNAAQQQNLAEAQRVQDLNTQQINAEKLRDVQAKEQLWQNQLAYGQAKANSRSGLANYYQNDAKQTAEQWQKMGAGVDATINSGIGAAAKSDKKSKENIESAKDGVEDMLDKLSEYHYNYKDDDNKEYHTGVMAQDLEKSKSGKELVVDTNDGKYVDFNKAGGLLFASLANINKRLKELEE